MSLLTEFCNETEALLLSCTNPHNATHPDSPNTLRNHFITLFLKRFLPSTIHIGSGEIIDHFGTRSTHQDLVLYRSDFPIFPTTTTSKIFLMESVLATIEIHPPSTYPDLIQPFTRSASVKKLKTAKHRIFADNSRDHMELSSRLKPKTFIFSFDPQVDHQTFYDNYYQAKQATQSKVPDGICIIGNNGLYAKYDPEFRLTNFFYDEPLTRFFHHLFDLLVGEINSNNLKRNQNASTVFNLNGYLVTLDSQGSKGK